MTINVTLLVAETNSSGFMGAIFSVLTFIVYALGAFGILGLLLNYVFPEFIKRVTGRSDDDKLPPAPNRSSASSEKPVKVGFADPNPAPKPRSGLTLGDVDGPPPRSTPIQKPAAAAPTLPTAATPQAKPTVIESTQPTPGAVVPGDFEKALAQAGQRMDALLKQTEELNRTVKLAEKAKMDSQVELNKATTELTRQLGLKDDQIAKLDAQLDRKSTFPSLRALIDVKKLCLDMLNTQKEVPREQLVSFVTAEIDSQLANLEVQVVEFPVGTPLEKIPGDQVETDRRQEPTDDPTKNNQVARLLRPCYFLERDTKRIVVAKALVILYRYNQPSPAPEATPSTPAN
jgi:hypothetical protein